MTLRSRKLERISKRCTQECSEKEQAVVGMQPNLELQVGLQQFLHLQMNSKKGRFLSIAVPQLLRGLLQTTSVTVVDHSCTSQRSHTDSSKTSWLTQIHSCTNNQHITRSPFVTGTRPAHSQRRRSTTLSQAARRRISGTTLASVGLIDC